MRENGRTASDAANHFKNFSTVDLAFGDDFTVLPTFIPTDTVEELKNCGKKTRTSADAVAEFASSKGLRMLSFVHDVIYLRALCWASYRKFVRYRIQMVVQRKANPKFQLPSVKKYAQPEKVVQLLPSDGGNVETG